MFKKVKLIIVITVGLISTVGSYFISKTIENERLQTIFEKEASNRTGFIYHSIEMTELVTESLRNLFLVSKTIQYEDFVKFYNSYNKKIIGLQSVEWVPKVTNFNREEFIKNARETMSNDFNIVELDKNNNLVPAKKRDVYFPVYYLEPIFGNKKSLGYDLGSNKARSAALMQSALSDNFRTSGRIDIVKDSLNKEYGIRLFEPVIPNARMLTEDNERFNNLLGFVGAVFKPKEIVEGSIALLNYEGIDIALRDESAPDNERLLYYHKSKIASDKAPITAVNSDFIFVKRFNFGGRVWSITCMPVSEFFGLHKSYIPPLIAFIFLSITVFFTYYYFKHSTEKEYINKLVEARTKELKESKENLDLVIKGAELGIWDWNIKNGALIYNDRLAEMLEYKPGEIRRNIKSWIKLIQNENDTILIEKINRCLNGEKSTFSLELKFKTKSGNYKWVQSIGKIYRNVQNGEPERAIGIQIDISDRKEDQQKLLNYSSKLESMNKNKDKLLSVIAHDLKSPLVSVKGFSEFILTNHTNLSTNEIISAVENIYESSNNFQSILEGLLNWGKSIRNQMEYTPKIYDLNNQIKKVISQQRINLIKKAINLDVVSHGNVFVYADQNMIEITLRNLLSNAVKFTPINGDITISVRENKNNTITVSIKDTGVGMPEDNIKNLFKNSYNVSTRGTEGEKGTGLGLAICTDIIRRNGGEIWGESKENRGTTFFFTLPTDSEAVKSKEEKTKDTKINI